MKKPVSTPRNVTHLRACKRLLFQKFGRELPQFGMVLGSGFQEVLSAFQIDAEISFSDLPGFPSPGVKGHPGRLVLGTLSGLPMLVAAGRAHYYEGHSMDTVMFPIDLLAECRVSEVLLTNAAGGINRAFRPGEFMLFSDHINLFGVNPLRGFPVSDGRSFVDLSETYCPELRSEWKRAAKTAGITLREGVYLGVSGPSYETPTEIRAFRKWGADAVGMSTIPEVLMARYRGLRVAALSCITNFAAGMRPGHLSHSEVLASGRRSAQAAIRLFRAFASNRAGIGKTI